MFHKTRIFVEALILTNIESGMSTCYQKLKLTLTKRKTTNKSSYFRLPRKIDYGHYEIEEFQETGTYMVTTRLVIDNGGMILKATKKIDEPKAALCKRVNYTVFVR